MMGGVVLIKYKITPKIKNKFIDKMKKTRDTGKEQGFPMCINKEGELFVPAKECEGEKECGFVIKDVHQYCPDRVQGAFHTHPFLIKIEEFYGRKPSEKELEDTIKLYRKHFERKGITMQSPSHHDLVDTLLNSCIGETEGTVCIGNDLDLDKVECWTVRKGKIIMGNCAQASKEYKENIAEEPRKWIKPLFDREVIKLEH